MINKDDLENLKEMYEQSLKIREESCDKLLKMYNDCLKELNKCRGFLETERFWKELYLTLLIFSFLFNIYFLIK